VSFNGPVENIWTRKYVGRGGKKTPTKAKRGVCIDTIKKQKNYSGRCRVKKKFLTGEHEHAGGKV